ncbi:UDP-Glc:alpha-D-GlcNAc-diphosphoundecaprenol beta-1,3-glucosyltransferase WfgD [Alistipes sp.]|nr:UDP-Glc:alpha-D-GlcNAc-diphosphoundecaprenol beta-1,3-glucosyltransferase WfgD [Alistipes sp.]
MRKREPVSIILPTYNRAAKIGKAIESVLRQTYEAFELLIIDDGSADDTEEVVRAYADSRIVYERMPENGGQSRARNRGMQMASYDYLAFEDSDDLWRPEKLEKQMDALAHADDKVGMVYHKLRYDLGEGRYFLLPDETIAREKKSGDIYAQLLWDNLIGMPTLLIKKECVESVGYMDEGLRCLEDYEFALRIAKKYHAVFLDEVYLDAEFGTEGISGNSVQYLLASCEILGKYKADYLTAGAFDHRIEIIAEDAERAGLLEPILQILEKTLRL